MVFASSTSLCGTAPSLVEMIISRRPVFSIDIPQNRYTLQNQGFFYKDFSEIQNLIENGIDLHQFIPDDNVSNKYNWSITVANYESLY